MSWSVCGRRHRARLSMQTDYHNFSQAWTNSRTSISKPIARKSRPRAALSLQPRPQPPIILRTAPLNLIISLLMVIIMINSFTLFDIICILTIEWAFQTIAFIYYTSFSFLLFLRTFCHQFAVNTINLRVVTVPSALPCITYVMEYHSVPTVVMKPRNYDVRNSRSVQTVGHRPGRYLDSNQ